MNFFTTISPDEDFLLKSEPRNTSGAKITHQNLTAKANNFAITPAFARAFTPNVPATKPPIPTAAALSPDFIVRMSKTFFKSYCICKI